MSLQRTQNDLIRLKQLYDDGDLPGIMAEPHGLFFLKLRSLERTEPLRFVAGRAAIEVQGRRNTDILRALFLSELDEATLDASIGALYNENAADRAQRAERLVPELIKVRTLDWGGIRSNDINRHIVDRYVKKIENFDELERAIETQLAPSVRGFTLSSWFNTWTSFLIEAMFNDHPDVLPAVGQIKMVDFFWKELPFDLKVTYFPAAYLQEQRKARELSGKEVTQLKAIARRFKLPFDKTREENELQLDLLTLLGESSDERVQSELAEFRATRRAILQAAAQDKRALIRWLYQRQGDQRFDASNRLFVVLVDPDNLEESWKLKRDLPLLKREIDRYLSQNTLDKTAMAVEWQFRSQTYRTYADLLFITKSPVTTAEVT